MPRKTNVSTPPVTLLAVIDIIKITHSHAITTICILRSLSCLRSHKMSE